MFAPTVQQTLTPHHPTPPLAFPVLFQAAQYVINLMFVKLVLLLKWLVLMELVLHAVLIFAQHVVSIIFVVYVKRDIQFLLMDKIVSIAIFLIVLLASMLTTHVPLVKMAIPST